MVLILPEYSQRPYRYGMTLLCVGALFNWLGLAENNAEPVRYIGVTLIAAGAMLICLAMCFWMKASHDPPGDACQSEEPVHHIVTIHQSGAPLEKPPDYDSVTGCLPPCYEEAIRLNPSLLLPTISSVQDVTDSRKQETEVPPILSDSSNNFNNIPAPPYSQCCAVNISSDISPIKNDNVIIGKLTMTNDVVIMSPNEAAAINAIDESSQNNDNFGSKVLRLSKRLLRGKRIGSLDAETSSNSNNTMVSTITTANMATETIPTTPDLRPPVLVNEDSVSPSTSNLPVR